MSSYSVDTSGFVVPEELDYYSSKKIYYFVGRLNPPHPGHIEAIVKAYNFMKEYSEDAKMYIYVTRTKNKLQSEIVKRVLDDKSKYDPKQRTVGVKHKKFENPFEKFDKQYFLTKMLERRLGKSLDELGDLFISSVVSPYSGIHEGIKYIKDDEFESIFEDEIINTKEIVYFMGLDDDLVERKSREGQCVKLSSKDSKGRFIKNENTHNKKGDRKMLLDCLYIKRDSHSDESASGMSASKIRIAASNNDFKKLEKIYRDYLDYDDIMLLIRLIRDGLNMGGGKIKNERKTRKKNRKTQRKNKNTIRKYKKNRKTQRKNKKNKK
jgi:hypothetical protein